MGVKFFVAKTDADAIILIERDVLAALISSR